MKSRMIVPVVLMASLSVMGLAGCQAASTVPSGSQTAAAGGAVLPVNSNPIVNASTAPGLSIVSAAVENNVDPVTKAAVADQLQVTVRNDTAMELSKFEIYYVETDMTTGQKEAYYQALTGFTVAAGATGTLYFDGKPGPGHFPENQFSIYRSSKNQVDFAIEVSASGAKIATATATKGAGTGEVVGG